MPVCDGLEAAARMRRLESNANRRRVPIIGLTGHEGEDIKRECKEAGMDRVLTKPIKRAELLDILNELALASK